MHVFCYLKIHSLKIKALYLQLSLESSDADVEDSSLEALVAATQLTLENCSYYL